MHIFKISAFEEEMEIIIFFVDCRQKSCEVYPLLCCYVLLEIFTSSRFSVDVRE